MIHPLTPFPAATGIAAPRGRRGLRQGIRLRASALLCTALLLQGCAGFDPDLRGFGGTGLDTSTAARQATAAPPAPDEQGIISYPTYQVAVARRGETVDQVAARLGINAAELASYNALAPGTTLNSGEFLALPVRVAAQGAAGSGGVDISALASGAIDRAEGSVTTASLDPGPVAGGAEPVRHQVARGETAYSIARYYNVNVRALADWNSLPADLTVREGQHLLIPVALAAPAAPEPVSYPGQHSSTPTPPSAATPLPAETPPSAATPVAVPPSPDLGATRTEASQSARMAMPVSGTIIRPYRQQGNEGIDISAAPGSPVVAAADGTVAAITRDTGQVAIVVVRHEGNLLTVYANVEGIAVERGASVTRGQRIAEIRPGDSSFLHFEVRQGFDSVDPMPYLE